MIFAAFGRSEKVNMGKRERVRRMKDEGLHEIKNKYRTRAVNKKRKGLVLTAKKKRRALKAGASLFAIFLLILGAFAIGSAFLSSVVPNDVPEDFVTVSYELPDDGSDPSGHTALENIGYMNYRFKHQPSWYMEMHGTTTTPVGPQSVNTFKQYSDGVLIMADIASSSMIKAGRQFCYVGDEVMWREIPKNGSFKANDYDEMMRLTFNDKLAAHMTVSAFKAKNGLPGTEFSVYIINEETIDHASEAELVTSGEWDGIDFVQNPVYKQTYYLRPGNSENLGAAAHYANQMAFTGGLTGLPEFNYIEVTYFFDSSWQVLRTEVDESYKATMGITVNCTSDFASVYEYGTDRAKNDDYENFFKDFVGKDIDDDVEKPLDALGMITSAFLTKPVTYEIDLEIDGKKTDGVISLDATKLDIAKITSGGSVDIGAALGCIGLKARIGDIYIYLEDSTAYLAVGNLKAKLPIDGLLSMISGGAKTASADSAGEENGEAPLFDLGDPVMEEKDGTLFAKVNAKLDLSSLGVDLVMPLNFVFKLDGEKNASLETLDLNLSYQGIEAKIGLKDTKKTVPELNDRDSFIDLYPYAEAVYSVIAGGKLEIALDYENADMRLTGNIGMNFVNGFALAGGLTLDVRGSAKTVEFAILNGTAYLNLDGIRISASLSDAMELIKGFLPLGNSVSGALNTTVDKVLSALFEKDLASLLSLSEDENALSLGIKGTELLDAFGVNFELGEVNLTVDKTNGTISVSAYGAEISVKPSEKDIAFDTAGYTELMPYAETLATLFKGGSVTATVSYQNELAGKTLAVDGNIVVGLSPVGVSGEIVVTYGALEKKIEVVYDKNVLYLVIDSLKVKADMNEAISLISSLIATGEAEKADVYAILEKVLAVNFGEILSLVETEEEGDPTLVAALNGTKLLNLFGVNFDLGEITLTVGSGKLSVSMLGADLSLVSGGEVKGLTEEEKKAFVDLKPVLEALPELFSKKALSLSGKVVLSAGGTDMLLTVNRGIVSFNGGIEVYLDLSLVLSETTLDLKIHVDTEGVKVAIGNVGAELKFSDLPSLGDAVVELYAEVRNTLNPIFDRDLLPEAKTVGELFDLLKSLLTKAGGEAIQPDQLLSGLSIENSGEENGLLAVKFMGVTLDIVNEEGGFVGAKIRFDNKDLSVSGELSTAVYAPESAPFIPEMPDAKYLNKNDFIELLDYLAATLNTLTAEKLSVGFVADIPAESERGEPYFNRLTGNVEYRRGGKQAFNIYDSESKKSVVVSPEIYLHVNIAYTDNGASGSNLYLELYIFNYKKDEEDDTLDFFVTLSKYQEGEEGYNPLKIYASADEIMSLLSVAVSALGVDMDILDEYLVSHWLEPQTVADLNALGKSILSLFGIGDTARVSLPDGEKPVVFAENPFIKTIEFSQPNEEGVSTFTAEWNGGKVSVSKQTASDGKTYLSRVDLAIGGTAVEVTLDAETEAEKGTVTLDDSYFKLEGIAKLLSVVATSVTHPTTALDGNGKPVYGSELNKLIYMNGEIRLGISSSILTDCVLTIRVESIAVVFEEDGVAVNARFSYDAKKVKVLGMADVTVINGDSTVNLTGKNGMVYIERTQTTDADGKSLPKAAVLHRAMPLANFLGDFINQAGFLFNLGDSLLGLLANIGGSDSGSAPIIDDFGDVAALLSCVYTENTDGTHRYALTLHGEKLLSGTATLGDIFVSVETMINGNGEEVVRNLKIKADDKEKPLLKAAGVITLTLNEGTGFTLRNPRGIVDADIAETYEDTWHDVAKDLREGMLHKLSELEESKWEGVIFIEGELSVLSYVINAPDGEKVIKNQNIVVSTGKDGNVKGTVYADFSINSYPSFEGYDNIAGFTPKWSKIYTQDDPLPDDMKIRATYVANEYRDITLVSDYEIEGFTKVGEVWEKTFTYIYGSALPEAQNEIRKLVGYRDANGNSVSANEILSDGMTLYADWELIEYRIYYHVDGVEGEAVAHYGDLVSDILPVPQKEGYAFAHWSLSADGEKAERVTGEADFYAVFIPETYKIVLKSGYRLEGFSADGEGGYIQEIDYVYGKNTRLPIGEFETVVDGVIKAMFLEGFTLEGSTEILTSLAGVSHNATLTAVWSEVKHKVVYIADGNEQLSQNYNDGDVLSLPAVPDKFGYRGEWKLNGEAVADGYAVYGDLEIVAEYTAETYQFTIVSKLRPFDGGFTEQNGVWIKTCGYTYDTQADELAVPSGALGHFFGGYYTREGGSGTQVVSLTNALVQSGNFTLYAYWLDSTVNVRLYSNVNYDGSKLEMGGDYNGYYYTDRSYNNVNGYALNADVRAKGYNLLGWWAEVGENYVYTTDVEQFYGKGTVALFAVWTHEIEIAITEFTNGGILNKQYKIAGTCVGSTAYTKDETAKNAYSKISVSSEAQAYFKVYGNNASEEDTLNNGNPIEVENGLFDTGFKNCGSGLGWNGGVHYGGIKVIVTYSFDGITRTFTQERILSRATYTVTFAAANGDQVVENVRIDCPFIEGYEHRVYADELAAEKGIKAPASDSEFCTNVWPHTPIEGSLRIEAVSDSKLCDVKIVSRGADGELSFIDTKVRYGQKITLVYRGETLKEYVVSGWSNTFDLTEMLPSGVYTLPIDANENGFTVTAQSSPDFVILSSDVPFEYNGVNTQSQRVDFDTDYRLPILSKEGYVFLGWWQYHEDDKTWTKATDIAYLGGSVETKVEALWATELKAEITKNVWSGNVFSGYKYDTDVKVTGGKLIGAMADEIQSGTLEYRYYYDNGNCNSTESHGSTTNKVYNGGEDAQSFHVDGGSYKYGHIEVKLSYEYNGEKIYVGGETGVHVCGQLNKA